jgi:hypothetical protein
LFKMDMTQIFSFMYCRQAIQIGLIIHSIVHVRVNGKIAYSKRCQILEKVCSFVCKVAKISALILASQWHSFVASTAFILTKDGIICKQMNEKLQNYFSRSTSSFVRYRHFPEGSVPSNSPPSEIRTNRVTVIPARSHILRT